MDLDQFKQINDTYGHQAGDKVLVATSQRIAEVIRPVDICGRWGGDEFIVLIEDCTPAALQTVAQRLVLAIGGEAVTLGEERQAVVSVSIGACIPGTHEPIEKFAEMADAALYAAKEAGRNRVVVFNQLRRSNAGPGTEIAR
jgi:diguanylate cyclase (GGDEF)-like protein